jgi:hypothetical protein
MIELTDNGVYDLIDDIVDAGGRLVVDECGVLRCQARTRLIVGWADRIRRYRDALVEMFNLGGLDRALMEPRVMTGKRHSPLRRRLREYHLMSSGIARNSLTFLLANAVTM